MRKLVTLCFRHSVHTEELLQLELLYWGGKGRRRGGEGGGERRGREGEKRMEGKDHTMDQPVPIPSLPSQCSPPS